MTGTLVPLDGKCEPRADQSRLIVNDWQTARPLTVLMGDGDGDEDVALRSNYTHSWDFAVRAGHYAYAAWRFRANPTSAEAFDNLS